MKTDLIERKDLLDKIAAYKTLEKTLCEVLETERTDLLRAICSLEGDIMPHFHTLFDDFYLRLVVKAIAETGQAVSIDKVNGETCDSRDEPDSLIARYDALKELDDELKGNEIHYIWHIQTNHYGDGGTCTQAYFATTNLYWEYERAIDKAADQESDQFRWIAPELQVTADFLKTHQHDECLIELWSGAY